MHPQLYLVLQQVRERITRHPSMNEATTRASLIDPVLEALGWDLRNPDEVSLEQPGTDGKRSDYILYVAGKAKLVIEAKGITEPLTAKYVSQPIGYAASLGIEWAVLTNGDIYQIYRALVAVESAQKLLYQIQISRDSDEEIGHMLNHLAKSSLQEDSLIGAWNSQYTDNKTKLALSELIQGQDQQLLELLKARIALNKGEPLSLSDIGASLKRLNIRITTNSLSPTHAARQDMPMAASTERIPVGLLTLIQHNMLKVGTVLTFSAPDGPKQATVQADGQLNYGGQLFPNLAQAAIRITGAPVNSLGAWKLWQTPDHRPIYDLREQLYKRLNVNRLGKPPIQPSGPFGLIA